MCNYLSEVLWIYSALKSDLKITLLKTTLHYALTINFTYLFHRIFKITKFKVQQQTFIIIWCECGVLKIILSSQHWRRVCSTARRWSNIPTLSNPSQVWKEPSCPRSHRSPDTWEAPQVGRTPTVTGSLHH